MKIKLLHNMEYLSATLKKGEIIDVLRCDGTDYLYVKSPDSKIIISGSECTIVKKDTLSELSSYICGFEGYTRLATGKNKVLEMKTEIYKDSFKAFVEYIVFGPGVDQQYVTQDLKMAMKRFLRNDHAKF